MGKEKTIIRFFKKILAWFQRPKQVNTEKHVKKLAAQGHTVHYLNRKQRRKLGVKERWVSVPVEVQE